MRIELEHVSVQFGGVHALRDVTFSAQSGEVTCLLGDNGAGKSTLIRVLSGVHRPARGSYRIDGDAVHFSAPRDALERGIATVHQDLALIPLLSVWRNFCLGAEPRTGWGPLRHIDKATARATARATLAEFGIELRDADQAVARMSGGERQAIAIGRALHRGARALILDEPTAALGVKQVEIVLRNIGVARTRGAAVILVTHNPQHALAVGDRFVVLRQGMVLGVYGRDEVDAEALRTLMS
ncbi:MAG TPA: ATP-binding cassette domain-containing protein [Longimicrobiales bacterium]